MMRIAAMALAVSLGAACQTATPPVSEKPADASQPAQPPASGATTSVPGAVGAAGPSASDVGDLFKAFGALGVGRDGPGLSGVSAGDLPPLDTAPGLNPGFPCPEVEDASAQKEVEAERAAIVPVKAGMTLSFSWTTLDDKFEHECLDQVGEITTEYIDLSISCTFPNDRTEDKERRMCRSDMRDAYMFHPEINEQGITVVGATSVTLSSKSFRELKETKTTRHRLVQALPMRLTADLNGTLNLEGSGQHPVLVNNQTVSLPVLRASGLMSGTILNRPLKTRINAVILDDVRFPIVLDYVADTGYSIRYSKITYPTEHEIERRLENEKTVDVYGIYFSFASDRMRKESEPVLAEIADVLKRHPDWKLSIAGHTDSIGSDESNLDLSKRRSAAVRRALVERHGIGDDRFSATTGYGESSPKDTNDTPEGRAKNRRVELVRQ